MIALLLLLVPINGSDHFHDITNWLLEANAFHICHISKKEGATREDIEQLPKFRFKIEANGEKDGADIAVSHGGIMVECGNNIESPIEHYLSHEDAVCIFLN